MRARQDDVEQSLYERQEDAFKEHDGHGEHDPVEEATFEGALKDVWLRLPLPATAPLPQSFPFPPLHSSLLRNVLNLSNLNRWHVTLISQKLLQNRGAKSKISNMAAMTSFMQIQPP